MLGEGEWERSGTLRPGDRPPGELPPRGEQPRLDAAARRRREPGDLLRPFPRRDAARLANRATGREFARAHVGHDLRIGLLDQLLDERRGQAVHRRDLEESRRSEWTSKGIADAGDDAEGL